MTDFICIGGLCFGATILNRKSTLAAYNEIKSPINNVALRNGFVDSHKLFDGTFANTILNSKHKIKYKYKEGARHPHVYFDSNYMFPHIDLSLPESRIKLATRYNHLMDFIKNPTNDYWYIYSLTPKDIDLSIDQIQNQIIRLSEFIDVSRIIFLGSKLYSKEQLLNAGLKVPTYSPPSYDCQNENFKTVVGDRYIVCEPSNSYDAAANNFIYQFNKFIDNLSLAQQD